MIKKNKNEYIYIEESVVRRVGEKKKWVLGKI